MEMSPYIWPMSNYLLRYIYKDQSLIVINYSLLGSRVWQW